jgi:MoxR-like ATPase
MVLATQNPVEQEGTYPLPEAQIDRFMLHVKVGHPTREEEKRIMERMAKAALTTGTSKGQSGRKSEALAVGVVASPEQVLKAKETIGHIIVDDKIHDYIVDVVVATRDPKKAGMKDLAGMVAHGASPRASIALNLAARAHAFLRHRGYVTPEDVKAVGPDVLRHRIILTYEAEAEEITSEQVVRRIFETVEVP